MLRGILNRGLSKYTSLPAATMSLRMARTEVTERNFVDPLLLLLRPRCPAKFEERVLEIGWRNWLRRTNNNIAEAGAVRCVRNPGPPIREEARL